MRLWLFDGVAARDQDRIHSFLEITGAVRQRGAVNVSNASRIRSIVFLLGRSIFPHLHVVVPSNT